MTFTEQKQFGIVTNVDYEPEERYEFVERLKEGQTVGDDARSGRP